MAPQLTKSSQLAEDFVMNIQDLPALSTTMAQLLQEIEDPNCNLQKVTKLVKQDVIFSAKVLRLANSAFFTGLQLASIDTAVLRLGLREIRDMALTSAVVEAFSSLGGHFNMDAFWGHCISSAMASQVLANRSPAIQQAEQLDAHPFYVCGLLHHLGILLEALHSAEGFQKAWGMVEKRNVPLYQAEREVLGFDHQEVGAALLKRWQFPEIVVDSARHHHFPDSYKGGFTNAVRVIHLSAMLCHELGDGDSFEGSVTGYSEEAWFGLGFTVEELSSITEELKRAREISSKVVQIVM